MFGCDRRKFGRSERAEYNDTRNTRKRLNSLKPEVISALHAGTYMTPFHRKLATKAHSLKLDILYSYHPRPEISTEFKQQVRHCVSLWYDEYRKSEFGKNIPRYQWERDYPFIVLLPVIMMMLFPKVVIQFELESPLESKSENSVHRRRLSLTNMEWGVYNNILQNNTCPLDNITAILSHFKEKMTESCRILETTPSETKFHHLMTLVNEFNFDKLRYFIANKIGIQTIYSDLIEKYNFYGSEGITIK